MFITQTISVQHQVIPTDSCMEWLLEASQKKAALIQVHENAILIRNELAKELEGLGLKISPVSMSLKKWGILNITLPSEYLQPCSSSNDEYSVSTGNDARLVPDSCTLDPDPDSSTLDPETNNSIQNNLVIESPSYSSLNAQNLSKPDLIGYQDHLESVMEAIELYHATTTFKNIKIPQTLLISGPKGVGKKSMAHRASKMLNLPLFYTHLCHEYTYRDYFDSIGKPAPPSESSPLMNIIKNALFASPSVLMIDGLELVDKEISWNGDYLKDFAALVVENLALLKGSKVFIISTCAELSRLDATFQGFFKGSILQVDLPNSFQRSLQIAHLLQKHKIPYNQDQLQVLVSKTVGYTFSKLFYLLERVTIVENQSNADLVQGFQNMRLEESNPKTNDSLIEKIIKLVAQVPVPLSTNQDFLPERPKASWTDINGYQDLKTKLIQLIEWPLEKSSTFHRLGVAPPSGVLLYGPSGVGKTFLVHAIASKVSMNFITPKIHQIFGKYLGDSELAIRKLFRDCKKVAPCILFLDNIDVIGTRRGWSQDSTSASGGVNERVLSTLLNEMDGIGGLEGVLVVACTSQIEKLDDALTRPGRFDTLIEVHLPNELDRKCILEGFMKRQSIGQLSSQEIDNLVLQTSGFTCADLDGLVREAAYCALESLEFSSLKDKELMITFGDLQDALETIKERISLTN